MNKNLDVFESDPIPKAVAKLAIPTVASMLVAVIYNMVDTFFVGKLGDPNQVAAVFDGGGKYVRNGRQFVYFSCARRKENQQSAQYFCVLLLWLHCGRDYRCDSFPYLHENDFVAYRL